MDDVSAVSEYDYWAFISYSHRDEKWARWLHRSLERYVVPRHLVGRATPFGPVPRRLAPIFRDRDEFSSGDDLSDAIRRALERSRALIVICSPAAANSDWVREEVRAFQQMGRGRRIFCLIVGGQPHAGEQADEALPVELRFRTGADGQPTTERVDPLAVDARASGDGKDNARLRIIAGLIGVGFDALRQREHQRRHRRMAALAAASLLAVAVMGGFTWLAVDARHQAEARRAEAEGLVEFMLGDLRDKLQPVGRLGLLDAVGQRVLSYYAAQAPDRLDDDALSQRARALQLVGQIDDLRGNLDAAEVAFAESERTTARLLARDPSDPQRVFGHAQSVYWQGYIAWHRGRLGEAMDHFVRYREMAQRLVASGPQNINWQAELEYAHSNLGSVQLDQGRLDEAAASFQRALAIATRLATLAPDDPARQMDAAQARGWFADVQERLGHLDEAIRQRRAERDIYLARLKDSPGDSGASESLLVTHRALGRLAMDLGRLPESAEEFSKAVSLGDALAAQDASNTFWAELRAGAWIDLAEIRLLVLPRSRSGPIRADAQVGLAKISRLAALPDAQKTLDRAHELAQKLAERDPTVVAWQVSLLSRSELLKASLLRSQQRDTAAQRLIMAVCDRLQALRASHATDQSVRGMLAAAQLMRGDQAHAMGEGDVAAAAWRNAARNLGTDTRKLPPHDLTVFGLANLRLGRRAPAAAAAEHLHAMGYRAPRAVELFRLLADEQANASAK